MHEEDEALTKQMLIDHCRRILLDRIAVAENAMDSAQEAARSEVKSSAGDKHETSRAMSQIDREMFARQAEEARKELSFIERIDADVEFDVAGTGAVVYGGGKVYFISAGLGAQTVNGVRVICISPASPAGLALSGKRKGEKVKFGSEEFILTAVV